MTEYGETEENLLIKVQFKTSYPCIPQLV